MVNSLDELVQQVQQSVANGAPLPPNVTVKRLSRWQAFKAAVEAPGTQRFLTGCIWVSGVTALVLWGAIAYVYLIPHHSKANLHTPKQEIRL